MCSQMYATSPVSLILDSSSLTSNTGGWFQRCLRRRKYSIPPNPLARQRTPIPNILPFSCRADKGSGCRRWPRHPCCREHKGCEGIYRGTHWGGEDQNQALPTTGDDSPSCPADTCGLHIRRRRVGTRNRKWLSNLCFPDNQPNARKWTAGFFHPDKWLVSAHCRAKS